MSKVKSRSFEDYNKEELEFLIGYMISRWAYLNEVQIQSIRVKEEREDNIFDNPGSPSFLAEINLK